MLARPIDKREAKKISDIHRKLLSQLEVVSKYYDKLCKQVFDSANNLAKEQSIDTLKSIPLDEINRDKRGFRIKPLRDSGFSSVWDIYICDVRKLEAVNGISTESAKEIKTVVDSIVKTVVDNTKIKLSIDNKTKSSTALIDAVAAYIVCDPFAKLCYELFYKHSAEVNKHLLKLKPATGSLKWMFASSSKKNDSVNSFNALSDLLQSNYYKDAIYNIQQFNKNKIQTAKGWDAFTDNPVQFYNVIEMLCPGVLGTDDNVYGLSKDLAEQVSTFEISLEGLNCQLRKYQEMGVKYALQQKRVLLGDEMGLGKTVQAIAAMVSLRNSGDSHFVVVCPASVLSNWCREIKKMSDLNVFKIHGVSKQEELNRWVNDGGVAVTTYETTSNFLFHESFRFSMLVVDEAHYIKNPEAKRTVNVNNICKHADNILFMTGTALENKVSEMVNLINMLKPDVAQSVEGMEFLASAPEFKEKVATVYYRRKREDVLTELPDLIENKDWCELNSEEEKAYEEAVLNDKFSEARRVSWNISDISKSSKANRMLEIVEEAEEDGRKVIVFSFFLDTINKIVSLLGDKCIGPINGSVPPQKRQELVDEFNKAPAGTVLASQIQAGGTGLNIQSASVIILCEPQFKPSIENQAISRAYRMGQTRNVFVHRLLCDETVDERITEILENKQTIFDAFADESVAANESFEIDEASFGNIIKEEAKRIKDKNNNV